MVRKLIKPYPQRNQLYQAAGESWEELVSSMPAARPLDSALTMQANSIDNRCESFEGRKSAGKLV